MEKITHVKRGNGNKCFITSRTNKLFFEPNPINSQEINQARKDNIFNLSPLKKTFIKKSTKKHFALAFAPRSKLDIPRANSLIMRPKTKMTSHFDMSETLFSIAGGAGLADNDYMKFKTEHFLKFGKTLEAFKHNNLVISSLSSIHKTKCQSIHPKIIKLHDDNVNLLLNNIKHDSILTMDSWKGIVSLSHDLFSSMNQMQNEIVKALIEEQSKNEKANQKIHDIEKYYLNEISMANKRKPKNDFIATSQTSDCNLGAKKSRLSELQREDNKKMLNIHKIEEEMKDLTFLLDKNKHYYLMYLNTKSSIGLLQKEIEEMKTDYLFRLEDSSMKLGMSRNEVFNLTEIIGKLEREKKELQYSIDSGRKESIEERMQKRKLRQSNMMNQSMLMLQEELLMWRYMYDKEKIKNQNMALSLEVLGSRVFSDKNKKSRGENY